MISYVEVSIAALLAPAHGREPAQGFLLDGAAPDVDFDTLLLGLMTAG